MEYLKMNILSLRKVNNLADFYRLYADNSEKELDVKKQYSMLAKLKTSLIRYVLPGWEFPLKLDGNLSALETLEGLKFMEKVSIHQAAFALEVQDTVFARFGDRVSDASQRVYRCELKKMMVWGQSQSWWKQSVETGLNGRTPTMTIHKKRCEHWHKLKPQELPSELSQELDALSVYMRTLRRPPLAESSWIRYRREILGSFGWLHRVKGVALSELSLSNLVPVAAIHDPRAAEQVSELVQEYLEWLRAHIGDKNATLLFALQSFCYIAEYVNYESTKSL
jgi:hypothetical protein